jgi:uracil-DNA glycosylase
MILGHDFHSEVGYAASIERGRESENQPTWRNLLKVLRAADIRLESCFFTNFYMGLRKGEATTGVFPGAKNESFRNHCSQFMIEQLNVMRPSLIVTLGKYVPALIAALSTELKGWRDSKGFIQIDNAGPLRSHCRFDGLSNFNTTVVALTHPSMRDASIRYRRYKQHSGAEAEKAMLDDALCQIREFLQPTSSARRGNTR